MKKNNHGGKRLGAGRPKIVNPLPVYSVRLSTEQAALLRLWGGGDLSAGLRWLVGAAAPLIQRQLPASPSPAPRPTPGAS